MSLLQVNQIRSVEDGAVDINIGATSTIDNAAMRVGEANGVAGLDADGLVIASQLQAALTIEQVADNTALEAITVSAGDVGKRLVRVAATGVVWMAAATGSGADKWVQYRTDTAATDSIVGVVALATSAEAMEGTNTTKAITPATAQSAIAPFANARSPRQGLLFDGSGGASVANVPAFGTGDFTVVAVTRSDFSSQSALVCGSTNAFVLYVKPTLKMQGGKRNVNDLTESNAVLVASKTQMLAYTKSGTTGTYYQNAVAAGTTTDNNDYTSAVSLLGITESNSDKFTGDLRVLIYNRALSASEITALWESGQVSGADLPSQVAGTALITGNNSTFAGAGDWDTDGGSISGGALTWTAGASNPNLTLSLPVGTRYRVSVTTTAIPTGGYIRVFDGSTWQNITNAVGTATLDFTMAATRTKIQLDANGSGSAGIDTITLTPLGALLAPDAAQPGSGTSWYDTSGNNATISWTTGVQWAVPAAATTPVNSLLASGNITSTGTTAQTITANATAASSYARVAATSDGGAFNIQKFGTTLGGTTWAGLSGNNQAVIDADASSLVIATYGASKPIVIAPNRTSGLSVSDTGITVNGTGTHSFAGPVSVPATPSLASLIGPKAASAVSVPTATPTTLFDASTRMNYGDALMVVGGDDSSISFVAILSRCGDGPFVLATLAGQGCTLAMSGNNLQITQSSGSTKTVDASVFRLKGI